MNTLTPADHKKRLKEKYEAIASSYHHARYGNLEGKFHLEQTHQRVALILDELGFGDLSQLKVLDLATGSGRNLSFLHRLGCENITGIDYVKPMLDQARQNEDASTASLVQSDAEHLPFKDHSFDLILSNRFFHLIPMEMKKSCLREAARVLKKDGVMVIEFINACYFLNPRTLLRTLWKSMTEKDYLSRKIIPWGWGKKFPDLKVSIIAGTWLPGMSKLSGQFPKKTKSWNDRLLKFPFNLLSERILVAFTLKGTAQSLSFNKKNVSADFKGRKILIKKTPRSFMPVHLAQFFKDRYILDHYQSRPLQHFKVLRLARNSLFSYSTHFEPLISLRNQEDALLDKPLWVQILKGLIEFQRTAPENSPLFQRGLDFLNHFFFRLGFFKRLVYLRLRGYLSSRDIKTILLSYRQAKRCMDRDLEVQTHGDMFSGGNLSLDAQSQKLFILDFENVRPKTSLFFDLSHIACKGTRKVFESEAIRNIFILYFQLLSIKWTDDLLRKALPVWRFNMIKSIIRRLHERCRQTPLPKADIETSLDNLAFALNVEKFEAWAKPLIQAAL